MHSTVTTMELVREKVYTKIYTREDALYSYNDGISKKKGIH